MTKPSSTTALTSQPWQEAMEACAKEADLKKLLECVHLAENAIFVRLQELAGNASPTVEAERRAIAHSLETLRLLKRDKLGFPDWKPVS